MKVLKKWMSLATKPEKQRLAKLTGTSIHYLYLIANDIRNASADIAGKIEAASRKIKNPKLPGLNRANISPACSQCSYAKKCLMRSRI